MSIYFSIAIIIISIGLMLSILFQVKGGGLGVSSAGGYGLPDPAGRRKNPVPAYPIVLG